MITFRLNWTTATLRPTMAAMAGSGDKAEDKERWFMESFGVDEIFTPETPVVSAKGAVVTNIAHIPLALTAVMKLNNIKPDFEPRGSLSLKPWIANDHGITLPAHLALPRVEALPPYSEQIKALAVGEPRTRRNPPLGGCAAYERGVRPSARAAARAGPLRRGCGRRACGRRSWCAP